MTRVIDPAAVQELTWSQMYNRFNCNPMILDLRPASEFLEGHLQYCPRIGVSADDEALAAVMDEQITQKYESVNKKHCILLASQADWAAHQARILKALASSPRFKCYYRCHCFSETLSFAPFLASEPKLVGVPSLIECLLPARVFLSGIVYASPAFVSHLNWGRIVNVTPEMPRSPDITTSFPIEDSDDVDIAPVLEKTRAIIASCVRDNVPMLVHCHQGVSRSASVVVDYVASSKQISADSAINLVRCSRGNIRPNAAFTAQLQRMHRAILFMGN